jgi:MipA family protein
MALLWAVAPGAWAAEDQYPAPSQGASAPAPVVREWDAALGLIGAYAPAYPGAAEQKLKLTPGVYLRWGRVSMATRSGMVSRNPDPNEGAGFKVDLSASKRWRFNLGLRFDSGRQEALSPELLGTGDIRRTMRGRLSAGYELGQGWTAGSSLSTDLLGHHGGSTADFSVGRSMGLSERTRVGFGVSVTAGDQRYMQSYFGITAGQSQRSHYRMHQAHAGVRDVGASVTARTELGGPWAVFYGANAMRLLGQAATSPLSRTPHIWSLHSGMAYRF